MSPSDLKLVALHAAKVESEAWLRRFSAYLDAEARRHRSGTVIAGLRTVATDPIPETWASLDTKARERRRMDAPCTCTLWPHQPCPRHGVPLSSYDAAVDAAAKDPRGLRPFGCFCPVPYHPELPSGDCRIHQKLNPPKSGNEEV